MKISVVLSCVMLHVACATTSTTVEQNTASATEPAAREETTAVPAEVPAEESLARRSLGALAYPASSEVLSSAFRAHGSVDLTAFEGLYVSDEPREGFAGTQIEGNVTRFGVLPRAEIAPVLVLDRDADELLALALWHEDVDDPGDASLVYVFYRREANGDLSFSFGGSSEALWGEEPTRLRRVESPLPGLRYRPDVAALGLPMMFAESGGRPCRAARAIPHQGRYELDVRAMAAAANDFETSVRDAALHSLVGELALGDGGIWNPRLAGGHCVQRVSPKPGGGFVLGFRATTFDEIPTSFDAHVTATETGIAVRFVSSNVPLDTAVGVFYRRIGEFAPLPSN